MKSIQEYTDYLFNCRFTDENFDPQDHEDHLRTSWELFESYDWNSIYPVWLNHLYNNCPTPEDVINFVNLYIYYEASEKSLDNPLGFIGYLYYRVDMDEYWDEAGDLFEDLAIAVLSKHGLINTMEDPYYKPMKDERILTEIKKIEENNE